MSTSQVTSADDQLDAIAEALGAWQLVVAEAPTAAEQMVMDERLAARGRPTFRLFRWDPPALSLGFRQPRPPWLDGERLRTHGIELVERPTGGGMAVHGSDLSCSVMLPASPRVALHDLMGLVCESVATGLGSCGVPARWLGEVERLARIEWCLTEASSYALMVGTRKLAGFAIRRYPDRWLIQGSILIRAIPLVYARVLPSVVDSALRQRAVSLEEARGAPIGDAELIDRLFTAWRSTWGLPSSTVHSHTSRFSVDGGLSTVDSSSDAV